MKRKNLLIDQDNTKRIKIYDSKNGKQEILECYIALAKLFENDPIIIFNPKPQLDVKLYFTDICSKLLHFLRFTSNKIINDSSTQLFAGKVLHLIDNIAKEFQAATDIFPNDFFHGNILVCVDISFYINNCLENCNSNIWISSDGDLSDKKLVSISKTKNYGSQMSNMIENGCLTNHIRLLKLMIEKGVKRNITSLLKVFFFGLTQYVVELSCIFIDILQSLHYTTIYPVTEKYRYKKHYELLEVDDENIIDFALSCIDTETKITHLDFIDPYRIMTFIKHGRQSIIKSSLNILLNIIWHDTKDNTDIMNELLHLLLQDNSITANLLFSRLTYFVSHPPDDSKKRYFGQIYRFITNNIKLLNNIDVTENMCILLKSLFICCDKEVCDAASSLVIIDAVTNVFNTKKNTFLLLDVIIATLTNGLIKNYGDKIYNNIIGLITNDDQCIMAIAVECFCRLCELCDDFVCSHQGLMVDTIINFLTSKSLKCESSQCSSKISDSNLKLDLPDHLGSEICPLKSTAITNMWISLGALITRPRTNKSYKLHILQIGAQKQIFNMFDVSVVKYCTNKHAIFIMGCMTFLGFDDCARNNNVKILIEKLITIACTKSVSIEKNNCAFDRLIGLNCHLSNLRYCFKIVDIFALHDSTNPVAVSFFIECYHHQYVKMNELGPWDDPDRLTERAIEKCTKLIFSNNKLIVTSIKPFLSSFLTIGSSDKILKNVEFLIWLDIINIFQKLSKSKQEITVQCICECVTILAEYPFALASLAPLHKMMVFFLNHHNDNVVENSIKFLHINIDKDNSPKTLTHIIPLLFLGQETTKLILLCRYIGTVLRFPSCRDIILGEEDLMDEMIKLLSHDEKIVVQTCCGCLRMTIDYDECYKVFYHDRNLRNLTEALKLNPANVARLVMHLSIKSKLLLVIFSYVDFVKALFNLRNTDDDCETLWDSVMDNDKLIAKLKSVIYSDVPISEWETYAMLCMNGAYLEKKVVAKLARMDNLDQEDFYVFLKIISLGYCNDSPEIITLPTTFSGCDLKNCHETIYFEKRYCDVTFIVENVTIKCHRCILAATSEYFDTLFSVTMAERNMHNITIKEVSAHIFQKIIQYVYIQTLTIESIEELVEIFYLADRFDLPQLVETCIGAFVSILSAENVMFINLFAEKNEIIDIKFGIYRWLISNYAMLPENLMILIDEYWIDIMNYLIINSGDAK